MHTKEQINEVEKWLREHKAGNDGLVHNDLITFEEADAHRGSCCWGNPRGGIVYKNYRIHLCKPSAQSVGDKQTIFFTFKVEGEVCG